MVTQTKKRLKASLHISVDAELSSRLRRLSEKMSIPLSHFASMALSRAVIVYEKEMGGEAAKFHCDGVAVSIDRPGKEYVRYAVGS